METDGCISKHGHLRHFQTIAISGFVFGVLAFHVGIACMGFPFYRDQHLGAAIDYARNGVDWLHPVIPGFTANGVATPQEFPIWQAVAGWLLRVGGEWWGMATLASLLFFVLSVFFVYRLSKELSNAETAKWATLAWVAQPLVFLYGGRAGTDIAAITAMIGFVWFMIRALNTMRAPWIVVACLFGMLSATLKLPFFFCAGLFLAAYTFANDKANIKKWSALVFVGLVSAVVFFAWTHCCNTVLATAQHPYVELRLSENKSIRNWYFGSLKYRLNPFIYARWGWRFMTCVFGSWALFAVAVASSFQRKNRVSLLWMLAGAGTILVFTCIVLEHYNYILMFTPAVALLLGSACSSIDQRIDSFRSKLLLRMLVPLALTVSLVQGLVGMNVVLLFDPFHKKIGEIIAHYTVKEDKLLIQGAGWGNLFILSDRDGHTIYEVNSTIEELGGIEKVRAMGFTKLVLSSPESPMQNAVQRTKPSQSEMPYNSYTGADEPPANEWKTLYRDEFVCIKEIPDPEDKLTPLE